MDFNKNPNNLTDTSPKEFLESLECVSFRQDVNIATHKHGHTLDLIISYGLNVHKSSRIYMALSGHYCVFNSFSYSLKNKNMLSKNITLPSEVCGYVYVVLCDWLSHFLTVF